MPSIPFRVLLATLAMLSCHAAPAQCELQWRAGDPVPSPRGEVNGTTLWDPDGAGPLPASLVVCGDFAAGEEARCSVAMFDGEQWTAIGGWIGVGTCITVHNGDLVVGAANVLRRWTSSAWQPFGTVGGGWLANRDITALAVFQGDLIVGGRFQTIDGAPLSRLARWNGSSWFPLATGLSSGFVRALAVHTWQFQPALYIGGTFTLGSGSSQSLAVWTGSAFGSIASPNGEVMTLAVRTSTSAANSYLFVGGLFSMVGALAAPRVARYVAATDSWSAVGSLPGSDCRALYVRNTTFSYELLAGDFVHDVWRWNGSTWSQLGPSPSVVSNANLQFISRYGNRYVLGSGTQGGHGSMLVFDGIDWRPLTGGLNSPVRAVLANQDDLVIGGAFATIGGTIVHGVATGSAGAWQALGGGVTGGLGEVRALLRMPNGDVVAAGSFTSATGGAGNHIARWDGSAWQPLGAGVNGPVHALARMPNGDLVAGGEFTTAGAVAAARIARWNGAFWTALGGGVAGPVRTLAVAPNGDLIVGGSFAMAGGVPAANVARYDGATWSSLGLGTDGDVLTVAVTTSGEVLVGGSFATAGGVSLPRLARWAGSWSGLPGVPNLPFTAAVRSLVLLADGSLVIAGDRAQLTLPVFGPVADNALRLRAGQLEPLAVGADLGDTVHAGCTTAAGALVLAGDFVQVGGLISGNVAVMAPACPASSASYGSGCTGLGGPDLLAPLTLPWIGEVLRTRGTGIPPSAIAVFAYGGQPALLPLSLLLPQALPGCSLLVAPEILELALPVGGVVDAAVQLPSNPALVGVALYHQMVTLELGALGQIAAITSSNGLELTVGSF